MAEEERALGLIKLPYSENEEGEDCTFPDEESVIEIATRWGVDPSLTKYQGSKSIGYLCELYY